MRNAFRELIKCWHACLAIVVCQAWHESKIASCDVCSAIRIEILSYRRVHTLKRMYRPQLTRDSHTWMMSVASHLTSCSTNDQWSVLRCGSGQGPLSANERVDLKALTALAAANILSSRCLSSSGNSVGAWPPGSLESSMPCAWPCSAFITTSYSALCDFMSPSTILQMTERPTPSLMGTKSIHANLTAMRDIRKRALWTPVFFSV